MASATEPGVGDIRTESGPGHPEVLSHLHVLTVLVCAMGFAIDLCEFAVGNALSAIFSIGPHALPAGSLSWLVCSTYAGAAVGAPLIGRCGDRFGMRRTMVLAMVALAIATIWGAASTTTLQLTVARFAAGMALGGYPPLMIAYLTDVAPRGRSGMMIFWTCAVAYLGPPAMLFAIRYLTVLEPFGVDGWRWALAAAGLLAFIASQALRGLPEGPEWLLASGRPADAALAARRLDSSPVPLRTRTNGSAPRASGSPREPDDIDDAADRSSNGLPTRVAAYALGYALIAVATVAFPLLTGPVLLARGISLTDTLFYVGMGSLGPVVGTLACSAYIDRMPKRVALILCASLMAVSVVGFFASHDSVALVASVMTFGICMALYLPTFAAYGAEMFPIRIRAAATSAGWASNRLGAALAPAVLLPLVRGGRTELVETLLCLSLLATIVLLVVRPKRHAVCARPQPST